MKKALAGILVLVLLLTGCGPAAGPSGGKSGGGGTGGAAAQEKPLDTRKEPTVTWFPGWLSRNFYWDGYPYIAEEKRELTQGLFWGQNSEGDWGCVDARGQEIIPPRYEPGGGLGVDGRLPQFSEGLTALRNSERLCGYLDAEGKTVIPFRYKTALPFSEGMAVVSDGDYWGVINAKGEEIVPFRLTMAFPFSEGLAAAQNSEGLWGYIDAKGETVIPFQYIQTLPFCEGVAPAQTEDTWVFIDPKGKESVSIKYPFDWYELYLLGETGAYFDEEGLLKVRAYEDGQDYIYFNKKGEEVKKQAEGPVPTQNEEGLWGYADAKGEIVIPCQYQSARSFSEGLASVMNSEGLWGFIDTTGKEVAPCQYQSAWGFSEGLAAVQNSEELWGFIDQRGKEVIPCQYQGVRSFYEGLAAVQNSEGLWGFINPKGQEVIPCQYDGKFEESGLILLQNFNFRRGVCFVRDRGALTLINAKGEELLPDVKFAHAGLPEGNSIIVREHAPEGTEGRWGVVTFG